MAEGWGQYEDIEVKSDGRKKSKSGREDARNEGSTSSQQQSGRLGGQIVAAATAAVKARLGVQEEDDGQSGSDTGQAAEAVPVVGLDQQEVRHHGSKAATVTAADLAKPARMGLTSPILQNIDSEPRLDAFKDRNGGKSETLSGLDLNVQESPSCPNFGSLEAAHRRIFDSGLTFSEAKGQIWKLRKSGMLMKRGFRYRKLWVKRYVEISGRMLKYYEKKPKDEKAAGKPRGMLELTKNTIVVAVPDSDGIRFAFNVIPDGRKYMQDRQNDLNERGRSKSTDTRQRTSSGGGWFSSWFGGDDSESSSVTKRKDEAGLVASESGASLPGTTMSQYEHPRMTKGSDSHIWRFAARNENERQEWLYMIEKSISLICRVEVAPTLCGVGSVHYHYKFGDVIGRGKFGDVFSAVATMTGHEYAIKVVDKEKRVKTKEDALMLRMEIKVMRKITRELDHANICKLFQAYEDSMMVYLVMEKLSGGDLYEHISENVEHYTEDVVADVIRQVAGALKELHGAGIVLCDLRPEHVLYTSPTSNVVKVVEFGRAIFVSQQQQQQYQESNPYQRSKQHASSATFTQGMIAGERASASSNNMQKQRLLLAGSPGFTAPEVFSLGEYSPTCDIWALGCILFTLLVGYQPFSGVTVAEIFKSSSQGLQADKLNKEDWQDVSTQVRSLIGAMLRTDAERRIDAQSILTHPWIMEPGHAELKMAHDRIKKVNDSRRHRVLPGRRSAHQSPVRNHHQARLDKDRKVASADRIHPSSTGNNRNSGLRSSQNNLNSNNNKDSSSDKSRNRSSPDLILNDDHQVQPSKVATDAFEKMKLSNADQSDPKNAESTGRQPSNLDLKNSSSTFFELLQESNGELDSERRAELLALDVRAEKIRQQSSDIWNLPRSPRAGDDYQANFAPAGRFLNDLEGQMRRVRETEQLKLEKRQQRIEEQQQQQEETRHAVTLQQVESAFAEPYVDGGEEDDIVVEHRSISREVSNQSLTGENSANQDSYLGRFTRSISGSLAHSGAQLARAGSVSDDMDAFRRN